MTTSLRTGARCALIGFVLAAAGVAGCSQSEPAAKESASADKSATSAQANCERTPGHASQGPAFGALGAETSRATLAPGPAVTVAEARREAPARRGTPLIISGTVYAPGCRKVLAGATVEAWQADAKGEYGPGHGTSQLRCCYLVASLRTDPRGRYEITTIRPGHYRGADPPPPAHIHVNVLAPGTRGLATELEFTGDPFLRERDPETAMITLHRESRASGVVLRGRFDIVVFDRAD